MSSRTLGTVPSGHGTTRLPLEVVSLAPLIQKIQLSANASFLSI